MDITMENTGGVRATTPVGKRIQPEPAPPRRYEGQTPTPTCVQVVTRVHVQGTPTHFQTGTNTPLDMPDEVRDGTTSTVSTVTNMRHTHHGLDVTHANQSKSKSSGLDKISSRHQRSIRGPHIQIGQAVTAANPRMDGWKLQVKIQKGS